MISDEQLYENQKIMSIKTFESQKFIKLHFTPPYSILEAWRAVHEEFLEFLVRSRLRISFYQNKTQPLLFNINIASKRMGLEIRNERTLRKGGKG
jgi:hypothetical protein